MALAIILFSQGSCKCQHCLSRACPCFLFFPTILEVISIQNFPYRADVWCLLALHFFVRVVVHQFVLKQDSPWHDLLVIVLREAGLETSGAPFQSPLLCLYEICLVETVLTQCSEPPCSGWVCVCFLFSLWALPGKITSFLNFWCSCFEDDLCNSVH